MRHYYQQGAREKGKEEEDAGLQLCSHRCSHFSMPHDHRDAEKTSMDGCCTVDGLVSLGGVRFRVSYSCAHTGALISQCLIVDYSMQ